MEFLAACARRLEAGAPAEEVLATMRERYSTVRCLNVKTCLVRQMCAPAEEYRAALRDACELHPDLAEDLARGDRSSESLREILRTLPEKWAPNVRALRVTRAQMIECKCLGTRSALEKNRRRVRVSGRELLAEARRAAREADDFTTLTFALMLLTGRRTCELLNGRSDFDREGPHTLRFTGQAKRRSVPTIRIPVLAPAADVIRAIGRLRRIQKNVQRTNRQTSVRYQSLLARSLACHSLWSQCKRVHGLRGVYACMALRLFAWNEDPTDAYIAMNILGHTGLHESLVYTPFHLGDDFADEPSLGAASLDEATVGPSPSNGILT